MVTVIEVLATLVVLFIAAAVATQERTVLVDVPPDDPDLGLPAAGVQPEDVAAVRFGMVVRGYRMSEVDEVLARLAGELAARDERISALEQALVDVMEPHVQELEELAAEPFTEAPPWPEPVLEPEPEPEPMPGTEQDEPGTSEAGEHVDADGFGRHEERNEEAPAAAAVEERVVEEEDGAFPEIAAAEPAPADLPDAVEPPDEPAPQPADELSDPRTPPVASPGTTEPPPGDQP